MPAGYEKMRDQFFEEKVRDWYRRHKGQNMPKKVRDRLYDAAQAKAARIWNSRNPKNPVGRHR